MQAQNNVIAKLLRTSPQTFSFLLGVMSMIASSSLLFAAQHFLPCSIAQSRCSMGTNTNNSSEPTPAASTGKTPAATTEVVTGDMQAVESSQLWSQKLRDKLPAFWAKCCQACLKTGPALLFTLVLALSSSTSHAFQNVPLAERSPTAQNSSEAYTQSRATNSISATTNNTV